MHTSEDYHCADPEIRDQEDANRSRRDAWRTQGMIRTSYYKHGRWYRATILDRPVLQEPEDESLIGLAWCELRRIWK